jgi:hypothetical protein
MTHAEDLMAHPPTMAEMAGGVLDSETSADLGTTVDGHDRGLAVAAELAAEGLATPVATLAAPEAVAPGLAALEAETEE